MRGPLNFLFSLCVYVLAWGIRSRESVRGHAVYTVVLKVGDRYLPNFMELGKVPDAFLKEPYVVWGF